MSTNETATQNEIKVDTNLKMLVLQKKYKTDAKVVLLALSGQPCILNLDDVWKEDAGSMTLKDYRVENLLATVIYYTHGVDGIRQLQIQRLETDKRFSYEVQMFEIPDEEDSTMKTVEAYRKEDIVRILITEKSADPQSRAGCCEMWISCKVLPDGMWKADRCEAGWNIRSSTKPDHLEFVSTFVIMSLMNTITSIRREDGGDLEEKYSAELA